MTGGGTASVAFAKESSFMGALVDDDDADSDPDYFAPGRNVQVQDVELSNALQRMREPDEVESVESIAQNLEGAFAVSAVVSADVHADVQDIIFNDAGAGFKKGLAATSRWFVGVDYYSGTAERELLGVTPLEYRVEYQQGGMVRYTLTAAYADEKRATSITPANIVQATDGSSVPHHGVTLTVDAAAQTKLQSATLSISNIARFQWGSERKALDAVIAAPQSTLDAEAIFSGSSQLEIAYGAAAATTPQDSLSSVTGSLELAASTGTVATFTLAKLKPDTYNWSDLVDAENDMAESVNYHVNGGVTVA